MFISLMCVFYKSFSDFFHYIHAFLYLFKIIDCIYKSSLMFLSTKSINYIFTGLLLLIQSYISTFFLYDW